MRAATAPITITGLLSGIKFIKPMVTFRVAAGEVVNIGAISAVVLPDRKFTPVIGPIPPNILAAFQAARPDLAAKMITRPMMRPYAQPAASEGAAKRR